jgi:hypothetical protein
MNQVRDAATEIDGDIMVVQWLQLQASSID